MIYYHYICPSACVVPADQHCEHATGLELCTINRQPDISANASTWCDRCARADIARVDLFFERTWQQIIAWANGLGSPPALKFFEDEQPVQREALNRILHEELTRGLITPWFQGEYDRICRDMLRQIQDIMRYYGFMGTLV